MPIHQGLPFCDQRLSARNRSDRQHCSNTLPKRSRMNGKRGQWKRDRTSLWTGNSGPEGEILSELLGFFLTKDCREKESEKDRERQRGAERKRERERGGGERRRERERERERNREREE